jgi:RNA polymerase sigma-70 factor (ECF subfamily)
MASTRKLHDAEDLMQEVFVRVFTKLHTLREPDKARPWLLKIARRACTDYHRRPASPISLPHDEIRPPDDDPDPRIERLQRALNRLPDPYREAITLFYLDGRSCANVASCLGISETAARTRVARGRLKLRSLLEEDRV